MQTRRWLVPVLALATTQTLLAQTPNTLTPQEKQEGWQLLWDGRSTSGWRGAKSDSFPARSWKIESGALTVVATGNAESQAGGDIITSQLFTNFDLKVDFKCSAGCNSGIKYFVHPNLAPVTAAGAKATTGSAIGYEYQILDDARHPDARLGRDGDRTLASLYDLLPASKDKKPMPIGEWNTARIVVRGDRIEHWLNGEKVVDFDRRSPQFQQVFALSKFRNMPEYATWTYGPVLLQEHGSEVSFRNVKIRVLPQEPAKQP